MFVLVSYQAGRLEISQHENYLEAKEQMDQEYCSVLENEVEGIKLDDSTVNDFNAEIIAGEMGHWVWHIEELD